MSRVDDPMELRVTTVGAALANTEVQIVDPETGERLPIGQQGELCTRGYLVMKGYDEDPEATAAVIDSEGWLHTGDLAAMRPDGYFSFRGRAKDTIIRGGENIYPREVEELPAHPSQDRRRLRHRHPRRPPRRNRPRVGATQTRRNRHRRKKSRRSARGKSLTSRSRNTSASSTASP